MVMPFFLILEYAEDLCMNILRRKGYRTQKTTNNCTKLLDHSHKKEGKRRKINSPKIASTKQPRPTN
jgi:hypothetical protein